LTKFREAAFFPPFLVPVFLLAFFVLAMLGFSSYHDNRGG
jgi:hypothetical protein